MFGRFVWLLVTECDTHTHTPFAQRRSTQFFCTGFLSTWSCAFWGDDLLTPLSCYTSIPLTASYWNSHTVTCDLLQTSFATGAMFVHVQSPSINFVFPRLDTKHFGFGHERSNAFSKAFLSKWLKLILGHQTSPSSAACALDFLNYPSSTFSSPCSMVFFTLLQCGFVTYPKLSLLLRVCVTYPKLSLLLRIYVTYQSLLAPVRLCHLSKTLLALVRVCHLSKTLLALARPCHLSKSPCSSGALSLIQNFPCSCACLSLIQNSPCSCACMVTEPKSTLQWRAWSRVIF